MAEDHIIKTMTSTAENILHDDSEGNLNLLMFHIAVGSYVGDKFRSREMNHQFPILAEKFIRAPLETFSSSTMQLIKSGKYQHITIFQRILLVDYAYNKPEFLPKPGNMLPDSIIEILEGIIPADSDKDYTIADNLINVSHLIELAPDNLVQLTILTEFEILPYRVNNSQLLKLVECSYPALATLFPNVLIVYFDMSGEPYDECPLMVSQRNPAIYTLLSDCMINFRDPITSPFLEVKNIDNEDDDEHIINFQWYNIPKYDVVHKMRFAADENPLLIVFARRFYQYFYRENLIPLFMQVLPYVRGKSAFHIATGKPMDLETIPLESCNMMEYLDIYLVPFIQYRLGSYHHNFNLLKWYLNNFRDINQNQRAKLIASNNHKAPFKLHGAPTLLKYIQAEMTYLDSLPF